MVTEVTVEQLIIQIKHAFTQVTLENGIGLYEMQDLDDYAQVPKLD